MRRFRITRLVLVVLLTLAPALAMPRVAPQATGEETVYITKAGKRYHLQDCPTLRHSVKIPIKLKDAVKAGYTPCRVCHPPALPEGQH